MLYTILRNIGIAGMRFYFRKIYFTNADVLPKGKPIILAANHPTAFLEPCLVACYQDLPLHFLVRGDLFVKDHFNKMLRSLNMLPVFRMKDGGYKKLKKNYDTFSYCHEALNEKKAIMILAEGSSIHEKRLRPLQKGTGRLAFGAVENYGDLDIHIIPVGVNYTYADQFRGSVMIDFGEPILLKDYWKIYQDNNAKGHRALMEKLKKGMQKRIIIIDEKEDEAVVEQLFILSRNNHPQSVFPIVENNKAPLLREMKIADSINAMSPIEKNNIKEKAGNYFKQLSRLKVEDIGIVQPQLYSYDKTVFLLIGFIPFLLGVIGGFLPAWIANFVRRKKVKATTFKSSVEFSVGFLGFIFYLLVLLIVALFVKNLYFWIIVVMLPFWLFFAIIYTDVYKDWKKAKLASKISKETINDLKKERMEILQLALN